MEKEKIIELLKNEDVKYVNGITIKLETDGSDYIRIDYMNKTSKARTLIQNF